MTNTAFVAFGGASFAKSQISELVSVVA